MPTFEVAVPDGEERGIEITCREHGESEHVQPGYRTASVACEGCGLEVTVDVRRLDDWRDLGEMC